MTCQGVTGVVPETTIAVSVTTVPELTGPVGETARVVVVGAASPLAVATMAKGMNIWRMQRKENRQLIFTAHTLYEAEPNVQTAAYG
jgi:hypothetical protein